jgi:hypothetical protein
MKNKLFTGVFIFISIVVHSQYARKYSNEFLNIGVGARAFGMGNAVVASTDDVNASYWNPAGLAYIKDNAQASFMHSNYFEKIGSYDFLAGAAPINKNGVLGLSFNRFGVDDIVNTLDLVQNGQIDYSRIKTFSAVDYAFYISYAQKIDLKDNSNNRSLAWGVSPKIIYRKVGSFAKAWGFGVDAGLQYYKDRWVYGVMLKDITTTYNTWNITLTDAEKDVFYQTGNEIPVRSTEITLPKIIPAIAYKFTLSKKTSLLLEGDVDFTFDGKRNVTISSKVLNADPHFGFEIGYDTKIYFRGGISNIQNILDVTDTSSALKKWVMQPNFGVGIHLKNITLDYAITALGSNSVALNSNIFSLKIALNKKKKAVGN